MKLKHRFSAAWRALTDKQKDEPRIIIETLQEKNRRLIAENEGYRKHIAERGAVTYQVDYVRSLSQFLDTSKGAIGVTQTTIKDGKLHFYDASPEQIKKFFDSTWSSSSVNIYANAAYGINSPVLNFFTQDSFIGWQACALLSQNTWISKACSLAPEDAMRNGWELNFHDIDPERAHILRSVFERLDDKYKIRDHAMRALTMRNVFGIRIMLPEVTYADPQALSKPFNIDGVSPGSYKGWSQIDPYWCVPIVSAESTIPGNQNFYVPEWWQIGSRRVHKSHLIILKGPEVADILKPSYYFGGLPLTQQIYEAVYNAIMMSREAPKLAQSKRRMFMKGNTDAMVMDYQAAKNVMEQITRLANNYSIHMIGRDDEILQTDTSLTDIDTIMMSEFQLVAGISRVPATKFLGTSPKGFNATGEYEMRSYHEKLESDQEAVRDFIHRHSELVWASEIRPIQPDMRPVRFTVSFNSPDTPSDTERGAIEQAQATALGLYADKGAIDGIDIRNIQRNNSDSILFGIEAAEAADSPGTLLGEGEGEGEGEGKGEGEPTDSIYGKKHAGLSNITGREMQSILRIKKRRDDGMLTTSAAMVLLRPLGYPDDEIMGILGDEPGMGEGMGGGA